MIINGVHLNLIHVDRKGNGLSRLAYSLAKLFCDMVYTNNIHTMSIVFQYSGGHWIDANCIYHQ